jgi:hypothetical protein
MIIYIIQYTFKVHLRYTQGTWKIHERYIQGTHMVHPRYALCQGMVKIILSFIVFEN